MEDDVDSDNVSSSLDDGATSSSGGTTTTYGPALNYKPNNKFTASVKLLEANLGDTSKFAEVVDKSSSFYVEHGMNFTRSIQKQSSCGRRWRVAMEQEFFEGDTMSPRTEECLST